MLTGAVSFISACKDFFGLKPGETLQEFLAEVKSLTDADRVELTGLFKLQGYDIK